MSSLDIRRLDPFATRFLDERTLTVRPSLFFNRLAKGDGEIWVMHGQEEEELVSSELSRTCRCRLSS